MKPESNQNTHINPFPVKPVLNLSIQSGRGGRLVIAWQAAAETQLPANYLSYATRLSRQKYAVDKQFNENNLSDNERVKLYYKEYRDFITFMSLSMQSWKSPFGKTGDGKRETTPT